MREAPSGCLSAPLSIARNRSVKQHDFAERLTQWGLRPRFLKTRQRCFHVRDAVESLQDHTVEVARDEIQHRGLEETRTVVETDRRPGFEAERVLFRGHMKIGGQNRNLAAPKCRGGK